MEHYQQQLQVLDQALAGHRLRLDDTREFVLVARLHNETTKLMLSIMGVPPGERPEEPDPAPEQGFSFRGTVDELREALQDLQAREERGDGFSPPPQGRDGPPPPDPDAEGEDRDLGEGQG